MTSNMQCIEISAYGAADVLRQTQRERPSPASDEVLIKVAAAGVNRPDVLQRMGLYPPPEGASDLPGLEVSGTIEEVGADVTDLSVGDAVCALLPGGGYAEYAAASSGTCLPVPENVSLIEAGSLPETFFTVWANVFEAGSLSAGETLLVHGATSGIGVTAIQLAKACDARVIATASSDQKCQAALGLGADMALRYDVDGWEGKVVDAGGADVVLDMAGGDFVQHNLSCLNPHGRHVSIAFLRGGAASINIMAVMAKRLVLTGSTMKARSTKEKARIAAELLEKVWPLFGQQKIKPVIDTVFDLEKASKAHLRMESGSHIGKILLTP